MSHSLPIHVVPPECPQCDLLKTRVACDELLMRKRIISAAQVILWATEAGDMFTIQTQVKAIVEALPKG